MVNNSALVAFSLFVLVLIVVIIVYIVYRMKRADLNAYEILKTPRNMTSSDVTGAVFVYDAKKLPNTLNGRDFSYSFWLYLGPDYVPGSKHRMLFARMGIGKAQSNLHGEVESSLSLSPFVFMNKRTNRLYIAVATNRLNIPLVFKNENSLSTNTTPNTNTNNAIIVPMSDGLMPGESAVDSGNEEMKESIPKLAAVFEKVMVSDPFKDLFTYIDSAAGSDPKPRQALIAEKTSKSIVVATVDYVPLQRWVNISFVVQENLLTVYMDGDIYTVENIHDLYTPAVDAYRPVFAGQAGNVVVGDLDDRGVPGYISRLQYFDYALNQDEIRAVYNGGPVKGTKLSKFGVSQYGMRTPVYKLNY